MSADLSSQKPVDGIPPPDGVGELGFGRPPASAGDEPLTVESLYRQLRQQILEGTLRPGTTLSQVKLADEFGTGRTPLREALRMLQREGFVEAEYNRRVRVAPLSTSDLDQVYASRVVMEAMAVRVSVLRFGDGELARLRDLLTTMDAFMPDPRAHQPEWEEAHSEFHAVLIGGAGELVARDTQHLQDQAIRYRNMVGYEIPNLFAPGGREHAALVVAAERRDADGASLILAQHLARSGLALLSQVNPTYDAVALRQALQLVLRDPAPDMLTV